MKKIYSNKHYCPRCFDGGQGVLKKLFLNADDNTLNCDVHGYVQDSHGNGADFQVIGEDDFQTAPPEVILPSEPTPEPEEVEDLKPSVELPEFEVNDEDLPTVEVQPQVEIPVVEDEGIQTLMSRRGKKKK